MIPVRGFEAKKVAVFGLARTGLAAARALLDTDLAAEDIARRAMKIAAELCIYTNDSVTLAGFTGTLRAADFVFA